MENTRENYFPVIDHVRDVLFDYLTRWLFSVILLPEE